MKTLTLDQEVIALQATVRTSAISIIAAIYAFSNSHTETELRGWLVTKALKVTTKKNSYTAGAKCATAEYINGNWTPNDQKASRYSRACERLKAAGVPADGVEKYMEDKTVASLMRGNDGNSDTSDPEKETENQKNYNLGESYLDDQCSAADVIRKEADKFYIDKKAGLNIGWNLALVKIGDGNVVETIAISGVDKKHKESALRSYAGKKIN